MFESGPGLALKKKKTAFHLKEEALFVCQGVCQVIGSLHVTPPPLSLPLLPPPSCPHWRSIPVASVLIISNTDYLKGLLLL